MGWQFGPWSETLEIFREALEVFVVTEGLETLADVAKALCPPHPLPPLLGGQVRFGRALAT